MNVPTTKLEKGIERLRTDKALFEALKENAEPTQVAYLLQKGANPQTRENSPIRWATHHKNVENVRLLLEAGADPNVSNDTSSNPLVKICSDQHPTPQNEKIARLLIQHGAKIQTAKDILLPLVKTEKALPHLLQTLLQEEARKKSARKVTQTEPELEP